jgi:hypothetical protein
MLARLIDQRGGKELAGSNSEIVNPVGCRNLVTPQGCIRESHHQVDHDVGPKRRSNLSLLEVSAWVV